MRSTKAKKLILHLGAHKTGTSSIQNHLTANRTWLLKRGFYYPQLRNCGDSHNQFAHKLALAQGAELQTLYREIRSASEQADTLILSAEEFSVRIEGNRGWEGFQSADYWQLRKQYLLKLKELVRDFDTVDLYLSYRNHEEYAAALYATNVLSDRFRWSFEDFITQCSPIFDYRQQLEMIRSIFDNVNVISFGQLKSNLVPSFYQWVSIPFPPNSGLHTKQTPDSRLILWLNQSKIEGVDSREQERRTNFCFSQEAQNLFTDQNKTFWASADVQKFFVKQCTSPEALFWFPQELDEKELVILNDVPHGLPIEQAYLSWKSRLWLRYCSPVFILKRIARRLKGM